METLGPRTYKVNRSEFPLSITIASRNTARNPATIVIVGHIREMRNGEEIDERDPDTDETDGIITYEIAPPQSAGKVDIVQTVLGFFATNEKDEARFDIRIETSAAEQVTTSIRRPTFNPGTATLKFQV
jgi:hypothetical protein